MLGFSWGRGKRLHFMCLPESVCVCVWFLLVHGYIQSRHFKKSHCYLRLVVAASDQLFPLRMSNWFHLLISCFVQWRASFCASSIISQDFTVAFAFQCPFESLFNITTACIEKIRIPYAWFRSPPACITLLLSQTYSYSIKRQLYPAVHWFLNSSHIIYALEFME